MKLNFWLFLTKILAFSFFILGYSHNIYCSNDITVAGLSQTSFASPVDNKIIVVIDPGHGGHDNGCKGHHSLEKNLNLAIAIQLGEYLKQKSDRFQIIYTRVTDKYVSLVDRVQIANDHQADLFISIHCNSNHIHSVIGSETYIAGLDFVEATQSEYISKHNKIDPEQIEFLRSIEMTQAEKMVLLKQSIDLATEIELQMREQLPYKSRGLKEAGFIVLKYLNMPGVLVETGFLSNKNQELFLTSSNGRKTVSNSLGDAIYNYAFDVKSNLDKSLSTTQNQAIVAPPKTFSKVKGKYTIELFVAKDTPLKYFEESWDKLESIQIVQNGDNYHYRTGNFISFEAAYNSIEYLNSLGFTNTKIVENTVSDNSGK